MNKPIPNSELGAAGISSPGSLVAPSTRCDDCNGKGKVWFIALDSTGYQLGECPDCDGTGRVEATCETCCGSLVDGFCNACDDYGLSGWQLAEHCAYGMAVRHG
jgi:DnaJ-class molecular chaperone